MATQEETNRLVRTLSQELQEENLALFAGAGLSASAGFVNWVELLRPIAEELDLDIEREKTDLVALAQYHCNANATNRSKLNQLLIDNFCKDVEITSNHRILSRLPISTYWTTNYDKLLETSLTNVGKTPDVKYTLKQLAHTKPKRDAIVYKMHGDVYLSLPNPDKNWVGDCQTENFHTRLWEAQLLASFREQGLLVTQPHLSPDFRIENRRGGEAWVEAVTANPTVRYNHVNAPPSRQPESHEEHHLGPPAVRFAKTLGNKLGRSYDKLVHCPN